MRELAIISALGLAAASWGCAAYIKTSGSKASPDDAMSAVVVMWIGPGSAERKHTLYIGIGDKGDNSATKYFRGERSYTVAQELEWQITWQSNSRVELRVYECAEHKEIRQYPDPSCSQLDALVLARNSDDGKFREVGPGAQ